MAQLPFQKDSDAKIQSLLKLASLAIECENRLWRAEKMPAFNLLLTPQRRLQGRLGLKFSGNYLSKAGRIKVAHKYQQATDWHKQTPKGFA